MQYLSRKRSQITMMLISFLLWAKINFFYLYEINFYFCPMLENNFINKKGWIPSAKKYEGLAVWFSPENGEPQDICVESNSKYVRVGIRQVADTNWEDVSYEIQNNKTPPYVKESILEAFYHALGVYDIWTFLESPMGKNFKLGAISKMIFGDDYPNYHNYLNICTSDYYQKLRLTQSDVIKIRRFLLDYHSLTLEYYKLNKNLSVVSRVKKKTEI